MYRASEFIEFDPTKAVLRSLPRGIFGRRYKECFILLRPLCERKKEREKGRTRQMRPLLVLAFNTERAGTHTSTSVSQELEDVMLTGV